MGITMEISAGSYRLTVAVCAVLITLFCLVGILVLNGIKVAEERQACAAQYHLNGYTGWASIERFLFINDTVSEHLNCEQLLTGE